MRATAATHRKRMRDRLAQALEKPRKPLLSSGRGIDLRREALTLPMRVEMRNVATVKPIKVGRIIFERPPHFFGIIMALIDTSHAAKDATDMVQNSLARWLIDFELGHLDAFPGGFERTGSPLWRQRSAGAADTGRPAWK
jgi:hypothetical protein